MCQEEVVKCIIVDFRKNKYFKRQVTNWRVRLDLPLVFWDINKYGKGWGDVSVSNRACCASPVTRIRFSRTLVDVEGENGLGQQSSTLHMNPVVCAFPPKSNTHNKRKLKTEKSGKVVKIK